MKKLFKFKYPKLLGLIICVILAYYLFSNPLIQEKVQNLNELKYLGIFIAGFFFSFGFTTPFAIGFFITLNPDNLFITTILGGFGALLADLVIFRIIKFSFMDEFKRLEKTEPLKGTIKLAEKDLSTRVRHYILYFLAGIIIASPLPDELGVSMLAGLSHIKSSIFSIISFLMNSLGILIIILL